MHGVAVTVSGYIMRSRQGDFTVLYETQGKRYR